MNFRIAVSCAALAAALLPLRARAQSGRDSATTVLPEVVVTAERTETPLSKSVGAVTVLSGSDLRALPARTLAEALQQVPGLGFVDFAGWGDGPQPIVRGFYGGGEADYVLVLLDGEPANELSGGRVNWDLIPLSAVESVEVLRGPSSPLYGDAAVGAVINVVTSHARSRPRWAASAGANGLAAASWSGSPSESLKMFADVSRHDGARAHAARRTASAGATATLFRRGERRVLISALSHARKFEEPGPLVGSPRSDPRDASPFFRFDDSRERVNRVSMRGTGGRVGPLRMSGRVAADWRDVDAVRTVPLSAEFADTKRRLFDASVTRASWEGEAGSSRSVGRLLLGADVSYGRMTVEYAGLVSGDAEAYRTANNLEPTPESNSRGRRTSLAAFAQYEIEPVSKVRVVAGVRADRIRDTFDADASARRRGSHSAVSPRLGASVGYRATETDRGHVFAVVSRSFKAPTMDQLFDQRTIPVPFPPFAITLSNSDLIPQRAKSIEGGLRHWVQLPVGTLDASVAGYSIRMRDELDFDVQQLRFVNVGRSRHRGLETSLNLSGTHGRAFVNYSMDDTRAESGPNDGKRLKAVPRVFVHAGAAKTFAPWSASFTITAARGAYLDDANTRPMPGYERVDVGVGRQFGSLRIFAAVHNLFDRRYSSTGFPDPAGSDAAFFYPAARRSVRITVGASR